MTFKTAITLTIAVAALDLACGTLIHADSNAQLYTSAGECDGFGVDTTNRNSWKKKCAKLMRSIRASTEDDIICTIAKAHGISKDEAYGRGGVMDDVYDIYGAYCWY